VSFSPAQYHVNQFLCSRNSLTPTSSTDRNSPGISRQRGSKEFEVPDVCVVSARGRGCTIPQYSSELIDAKWHDWSLTLRLTFTSQIYMPVFMIGSTKSRMPLIQLFYAAYIKYSLRITWHIVLRSLDKSSSIRPRSSCCSLESSYKFGQHCLPTAIWPFHCFALTHNIITTTSLSFLLR